MTSLGASRMTERKKDGTQLTKLTPCRMTSCQNREGDCRASSLITIAAPPPMRGSSVCSSEASKLDEINRADRKLGPTLKSRPKVRSLLARLACSTTTPFGVPVEPEV